ncbi:hypothetical protein B0H14DRAFT_2419341, partial [Mycena olivaceomarginata]
KPAEDPLPEGFPAKVSGCHIWDGKTLINKHELNFILLMVFDQWLNTLTAEEIEDVDWVIKHFIALGLGLSTITQETFLLKVLDKALSKAVDKIFNGIGLHIIRGLPVQKYDHKIIAFAGISAYIREHHYHQDLSTAAVAHLRDLTVLDPGEVLSTKYSRLYFTLLDFVVDLIIVKGQTAGNQVFHTDAGQVVVLDIIGLLMLGKAEKGGLLQMSSVGQLYNTFSDSKHNILHTLTNKYYICYDPEGSPIIHYVKDQVITQYGHHGFFPFFKDQLALPDNIPALTKDQHLALNTLHFAAKSASLNIDLQPSDLEFFNNPSILHTRTASEDSPKYTYIARSRLVLHLNHELS